MQLANTAALRSSDLSRQVGAAIMNEHAEVQSLGCNEVPRTGGGTYWEESGNDAREFQLGEDSNDKLKREMLVDIANRMRDAGLIGDAYKNDDEALREALLNRDDEIIEGAQFLDSLEYGRTVHAEMNAITDAARNGHAVRGCVLYANTFPCHNCAKHIVAAGIAEVIYLRPYPKSYTGELFKDSITIDPSGSSEGTVPFRQFIGITGPIYERLFSKRRWKRGDGKVPPFNKREAPFIRRNPVPSYLEAEAVFNSQWAKRLIEKQLVEEPNTLSQGGV
jgi:cytidine deaminase